MKYNTTEKWEEPIISIEGVLFDVQAGKMSVYDATVEIKKYFEESLHQRDEEIRKEMIEPGALIRFVDEKFKERDEEIVKKIESMKEHFLEESNEGQLGFNEALTTLKEWIEKSVKTRAWNPMQEVRKKGLSVDLKKEKRHGENRCIIGNLGRCIMCEK